MEKIISGIEETIGKLENQLDKLNPTDETKYFGGALRLAINYANVRINARNKNPNTMETRKARHIRSAEQVLENAEATLKEYEYYEKHRRLTENGWSHPYASAEDMERLRHRVENAKLQLARIKGDDANFIEKKKAELLEKKRLERLDQARGVANQQQRAAEMRERMGKK